MRSKLVWAIAALCFTVGVALGPLAGFGLAALALLVSPPGRSQLRLRAMRHWRASTWLLVLWWGVLVAATVLVVIAAAACPPPPSEYMDP